MGKNMKKIITLLLTVSISLLASNLEIEDAYARATPPNLPNSAAFMTIKNNTENKIALVKASSSVANTVELHTHDMKNGVMKMYQVPQIDIEANATTVLQPGGFHIMLIGLKQKPLKVGENIDIQLQFSNQDVINLKIPVKTVMGGMMKKNQMKKGNCGQGKCGNNMKMPMRCGQGKCGSN
jgi:copper(I)-binding protein